MTEIQAAIGRLQLRKLQEWSARRTSNAALLREGLGAVAALYCPIPPDHVRHAYYKFYCRVDLAALKTAWSRDRIMSTIASRDVPCYSGSCSEIYLEKAFDAPGLRPPERLPVARELGETSLMFLVHPTLGPLHMQRTIEVVKDVMEHAVR
jgi:dTDP-4-amino-4,6-dideoxygalactose transaminase